MNGSHRGNSLTFSVLFTVYTYIHTSFRNSHPVVLSLSMKETEMSVKTYITCGFQQYQLHITMEICEHTKMNGCRSAFR